MEEDYVRQMNTIMSEIEIPLQDYYVYLYDPWLIRMIRPELEILSSITVDYEKILESDITKIKNSLNGSDNRFSSSVGILLDSIEKLGERVHYALSSSISGRHQELTTFFPDILHRKPVSLDEAIQKILFFNSLFWMAGHKHNGLGRLDYVLAPYYYSDVNVGAIDRNKALLMLKEMCSILGKDTNSKSLALLGDTGQYIMIGGRDRQGNVIQNDLTEFFLDIFAENVVPDPKLILRVNEETNDVIWQKAIKCILTGCGSPLLINERKVMSEMISFGYSKDDVWNFGTSACWEPLIIGKSSDQNNPLPSIDVVSILSRLILDESLVFSTFEKFTERLKKDISDSIIKSIRDVSFDVSPLYSLFFDSCIERKMDFSRGGTIYSYHGIQIVGFPNFINALLNLKRFVYEESIVKIDTCRDAIKNNFVGYDGVRKMMQSNPLCFGCSNPAVTDLTNDYMEYIGSVVKKAKINGEKVKVGFSSPSYIGSSKHVGASLDGRKDGDPFAVHISPVSQKIDIQEIMDFAANLNYSGNRINGNVVDFIIPEAFRKYPDKLMIILKNAIFSGVYEIQLNVLDARVLKDAKIHPEKYNNLIVRVWGFSAYFNDLPEDYQDNLIRRAEQNE